MSGSLVPPGHSPLKSPYLQPAAVGIGIQDLTPDLAKALQLGDLRGAVIANVEPGSSAEKAGLQVGDVVIAIDGHPVQGTTDLRNHIGLTPAGSTIKFAVKRGNGKSRST